MPSSAFPSSTPAEAVKAQRGKSCSLAKVKDCGVGENGKGGENTLDKGR